MLVVVACRREARMILFNVIEVLSGSGLPHSARDT